MISDSSMANIQDETAPFKEQALRLRELYAVVSVNRHFQKALHQECAPLSALEANEAYMNYALDQIRVARVTHD